jgi:serine/threonine protein kinase
MSKTLVKSTPNAETLLISLLEDLCYLYEYDETKSKIIFNRICKELSKMGIISKKSYQEKNKPARKIYKSILIKLINSIRYNVIDDLEDETLPALSDQEYTPTELIKVFKDTTVNEPIIKSSTMDNLIKNYSRLHQDFIELEKIGKGGFGQVYKMYHKVDSIIYAVKKIQIDSFDKKSFNKVLNEVRSIARLNHQNIIRYYNSWIEYDIFQNNDYDSDENSDVPKNFKPSQLVLTLFIQMELCDFTLKEWLEKRDEYENFDYQDSKNIFEQIVTGLNFIHTNNLIHRDIKPANIFLSNIFKDRHIPEDKMDDFNYIIKIADFGLSKSKNMKTELDDIIEMKKSMSMDTGISNIIVKRNSSKSENYDTSNLGTLIYASPEQLDSYNYDYKTDLYSLGIILFELFYCHKTTMERQINIKNLRETSTLPKDFEFKKEALLIKKLLQKEANLRSTTDEILKEYFKN